jgi:hypothetical protein
MPCGGPDATGKIGWFVIQVNENLLWTKQMN